MKEYIEYNTRQRAQALSEFEKEFYKLMNNRYFHFFNLSTLKISSIFSTLSSFPTLKKFQTFFDSFLHIEKISNIFSTLDNFSSVKFHSKHFSVFGKTMENTRDYRHIDLVETAAKADKLTKQPSYRAHHIFHDDLIAVERYQTSVKMDKPIYTGAYLGCEPLTTFFIHKNFMTLLI